MRRHSPLLVGALLVGALLIGACQSANPTRFSSSDASPLGVLPRPSGAGTLPGGVASRQATPWGEIVSARIRDGATAFVEQPDGFQATVDARRMKGTFQQDGAHLSFGTHGVTVTTLAVGRHAEPWTPSAPTLGACVPGRVDPMGQCLQRLEYAGEGAVEWWAANAEGFEQGWTFSASPRGEGPLTIDLAVGGADVEVNGDGVDIYDGTGVIGTISGVTARDADGAALDVQTVRTAEGLRFEVADAGAAYPVEVDPTYSAPAWELSNEEDSAGYSSFGRNLAGAGDVNGDGLDDILIGECGYLGGVGEVLVYLGSSEGPSMTAAIVYRGDHSMESFGCAVAGGGDVNGDGYDDIIIGALDYYSRGSAYVFHGSASGLEAAPATTLSGEDRQEFGAAVAMAGDVNHDGYDDLIVGAPGCYIASCEADVYYGSASGIDTSVHTVLVGPGYVLYDPYHEMTWISSFGAAVAPAGDVNGDGYDDVVVGGGDDFRWRGIAYIYRGSAAGVGIVPMTPLRGASASQDRLGASVSTAGDVDGDGYDDVIVGAPQAGDPDGDGRAYVYRGSAEGIVETSVVAIVESAGVGDSGGSVSGVGDMNGDGYDDVIVGTGCRDDYLGYGGAAYVHLGSAGGIHESATLMLTSPTGEMEFGCPVAGAGDVDGDGYDDVLIADAGYPGTVAIFRGCSDADADGYCTADDCDDTLTEITVPYTAYADTDGDGYGDSSVTTTACAAVPGYVLHGGDCDETDPSVNPGATEICDPAGVDEDCDGLVNDDDDSVEGTTLVYADVDGDGCGGTAAGFCEVPAGYGPDSPDCDDANASIHPGAAELCDAANTDEDCDGLVDDDDDSVTGRTFYALDADGDGYGAGPLAAFCERRRGYSEWRGDCNDADATIHPRAVERCDAADMDEDCDGAADNADAVGRTIFHFDADGDGFGSTVTTTACDPPPGYVAVGGDCDDTQPAIHLRAREVCDSGNIDEDCDGLANDADPSVVGQRLFYIDNDGDGYGSVLTRPLCHVAPGYATITGDCDDANAAINPGAAEIGGDGIDENCDGRGT